MAGTKKIRGSTILVVLLVLVVVFMASNNSTCLRIISYNSNGMGAGRYEYINRLMRECNILLLQEHWLLDSQLDKLRLNINNVNVHAISGMEANELLVGRPYGGLAILWKCDLQCHIEPIYTKSKRLCAVMLKSAGLEVAIFNVYMPTENNLSTDVYESTLCEISSICEQLDTPFFIQGGDYNVDFQRQQSKHTRVLKNFIEKESLICGLDVNRQLSEMDNKVEYTYESKVNNSFTLIDHMIMSHNLAEHMTLQGTTFPLQIIHL